MPRKPDHGEDSYEGHGSLKGRKALIKGGDSGIGQAVAIAFAREGADAQTNTPDILELTTEQFDITMKTNLYALFWITKAAIPHLAPGSAIINTASRQAYKPSLGLVDYAVTKAGIVDFTKSISKQMIKKGVRVNAVAPGPFWTPLQPSGGQTDDKLKDFGKDVPMGRPGEPVELAAIYVLLASQEASYITGEIYGVTGGEGIA